MQKSYFIVCARNPFSLKTISQLVSNRRRALTWSWCNGRGWKWQRRELRRRSKTRRRRRRGWCARWSASFRATPSGRAPPAAPPPPPSSRSMPPASSLSECSSAKCSWARTQALLIDLVLILLIAGRRGHTLPELLMDASLIKKAHLHTRLDN